MNNTGFVREDGFVSPIDNPSDIIQAQIDVINTTADVVIPVSDWRSKLRKLWNDYHWQMRHYFYIHLSVFFCNTLICSAIVWKIEEYQIPYVDCWFISATCVFTCGLQTVAYADFSQPSQILLLIFTMISGNTIPAVLIKIYRAKRDKNNNEEISSSSSSTNDNNELVIRQFLRRETLDPTLDGQLRSLPNSQHLRVRAYIMLIVIILSTCFMIYLISFLAMGFWLKYHYDPIDLLQANQTMNPFYASLILTITSFNQNGLSPWDNGMTLFVTDIFMNIFIMLAVISGTSLFPAILRGVIVLLKHFSPWKYKIFFDYILLNNHRLSSVIFPSVQTRLYVSVTILMQILGVTVALILDFHNEKLALYDGGEKFMIFMFQVVNTRFGGYATITITDLSAATLLIFVLLMGIKPQMLCTINETPFEMEWVLLQTQQQIENKVSHSNGQTSVDIFLPVNRMKHYLLRQGSLTKAEAKNYFVRKSRAEASINELTERRVQRRMSAMSAGGYISIEGFDDKLTNNIHISLLRMKLLLIIFCRHVVLSLFSLLTSTRTWLFIVVFLICCFEAPRVIPSNPQITVFRIIFEVISAFGGCGLSLGFSNITSSLATVLSTPSKISLILVMCMGRHRGLLDSMKDQECIEYSAQTLIDSWKQVAIFEYNEKKIMKIRKQIPPMSATIIKTTSPVTTRF
ncbi:unnamed protein product [Adineta steineri]|uniref:Uncharacterized protein n=1 Tax=Adineta steineri TaxID=433720 RepID=A0A816BGZ9_9BILA|nr:unnamed protein product [Adineta steineri]CAF1610102.1 unnamed protein product [Adineta steineri]